jgi:hypothetical protein
MGGDVPHPPEYSEIPVTIVNGKPTSLDLFLTMPLPKLPESLLQVPEAPVFLRWSAKAS